MKAVITGGTKGIGRAIAHRLAAEGYDLAVCSRSHEDLDKMRADWQQEFPERALFTHSVDVSQKVQVLEFSAFITQNLGWKNIDVLVNNAGVFLPGRITDEVEGTLQTQMETNLYSAYHMTRALLPTIKNSAQGYIFNMCSIASFMAYPNGGSYSISKFALLGFSKVLREELKTQGVKVTAILPGATWSNSWDGFDAPESRLMQPDDVAECIISALRMSPSAVVEEIIIRPQLGDL